MEPPHWDGATLTGMEPPHWGRILISGDAAEGKRGAATLQCVSETSSALPHRVSYLSANLPLPVGSYFSVADLEGKQQHALSDVQMKTQRIQASPAPASNRRDLRAWKLLLTLLI